MFLLVQDVGLRDLVSHHLRFQDVDKDTHSSLQNAFNPFHPNFVVTRENVHRISFVLKERDRIRRLDSEAERFGCLLKSSNDVNVERRQGAQELIILALWHT